MVPHAHILPSRDIILHSTKIRQKYEMKKTRFDEAHAHLEFEYTASLRFRAQDHFIGDAQKFKIT